MRACCVSCELGRGWLGLPNATPVPPSSAEKAAVLPPPKIKPKRSQWSKGIAPGEYGGPPIDMRPLKMWGKPVVHPLERKDEFIWNIEWRPFFDRDSENPSVNSTPEKEESSSGFLSFNRVMEIDRVDLDLTKELLKPAETAGGQMSSTPEEVKQNNGKRWRYAPTRGERKHWDRNKRAMISLRDEDAEDADALASAQESAQNRERERYKKLKANLQLLTAGIGAAGVTCAFAIYSASVALSYGIGLAGSFAYVRMLGNSVDGFGGGASVKAAASGAPRLLVPVILTMVFNRWNELLAPEYGLTKLQLIPILVGFFTYKIATIVQVIQDEVSSSSYSKNQP